VANYINSFMSTTSPFNLDDLVDILASSGNKTFWFITKEISQRTYYLKNHNPKINFSAWTKDYMECLVFPNDTKAKQFLDHYFKNRKDVSISKGEVKL
jgi:hypothetical protein